MERNTDVGAPYRGRLAPSPSGKLHLGHARTFLITWLRARQAKGTLILRIEDLDAPRVVPGSTEGMRVDLEWLGLDWDGEPVLQSKRLDDYERALKTLSNAGHLYPCSCTRRDLASIARAPHGPEELGARYPGTCRGGPQHPGRPAAFRFRMETAESFEDGLSGPIDVTGMGGDFVVKRADGVISYQLAVAVDDAAMGITEVVRADDLISSTPRQIALMAALGHEPPRYLHVPLVLGQDGVRLSKRHHAVSIREVREAGRSPRELIGLLASSLGIAHGSRPMPRDLVDHFDLARMPRTPWPVEQDEQNVKS